MSILRVFDTTRYGRLTSVSEHSASISRRFFVFLFFDSRRLKILAISVPERIGFSIYLVGRA